MKILVACECSGTVRDAFVALGHDAWSCDLAPSERGGNHLQCDALEVLALGWDMMIAHPPCDYLTVSGNSWFRDCAKASAGILTGAPRREAQGKAVEFVDALWNAPIDRVAIENPIGRLSTLWLPPTQTVQPFHFGDPFRKATCLWLRGLPALVPSSTMTDGAPACYLEPPGPNRKRNRSLTYPAIAAAMAAQWSRAEHEFLPL